MRLTKFVLKAALNAVVVVPMLMWLTDATFAESMVTALLLSVIAYVIGDQVILRKTSNLVATVADAGLAFVFLWGAGWYLDWTLNMTDLVMIVAALGLVEYVFHRVLIMMDGGWRI